MSLNINNLIAKDKVISVEYPGSDWKIDIAYVPREELVKIREKCSKVQWDKVKNQRAEVLDDEKFLKLYSEAVIKGWSGLTVETLATLVPLRKFTKEEGAQEVEYNEENAYSILANSPAFDRFISDVLSDVSNFNEEAFGDSIKK